MKGSLKTVREQGEIIHKKTNFNDWSDPKLKYMKRKVSPVQFSLKTTPVKESSLCKELILSECSISSQVIEELRVKIKKGYPLLSQREIRDIKLPFYESLLLNLKEDGFIGTYEFINDLIDLDEEWHNLKEAEYFDTRPYLKSSSNILIILCNGMTKAEIAKLEKNQPEEIKTLLDLAIQFSKDESWLWLAEELYEQCVQVADNEDLKDPKLGAIAKHLFASFLLGSRHNPRRAKHFVEDSMSLSIGKTWNVSEITGEKCDILYIESCLLLHKIYLVFAQERKQYNIEEAIQLCRSSLHWAKQINCVSAVTTALKNLVMLYLSSRQLSRVLDYLGKYMNLCREHEIIQGICDGYILLATYHDLVEQYDLVIKYIQELLVLAQEHKIIDMMAIAHHKLATFNLKQGKMKDMEEHATKAYSYYVQLNKRQEMEETMCLTGIAQAQEIMSQFLTIVMHAEELDSPELEILLLWKTLRIPFFNNIKLFQPEAEINVQLKDKLELAKNEETLLRDQERRNEKVKDVNLGGSSRFTVLREIESSLSITAMPARTMQAPSIMNFNFPRPKEKNTIVLTDL